MKTFIKYPIMMVSVMIPVLTFIYFLTKDVPQMWYIIYLGIVLGAIMIIPETVMLYKMECESPIEKTGDVLK